MITIHIKENESFLRLAALSMDQLAVKHMSDCTDRESCTISISAVQIMARMILEELLKK